MTRMCVCVSGVHAVCDGSGRRVAGWAWAHVLQYQTCKQEQTGEKHPSSISQIQHWQYIFASVLVSLTSGPSSRRTEGEPRRRSASWRRRCPLHNNRSWHGKRSRTGRTTWAASGTLAITNTAVTQGLESLPAHTHEIWIILFSRNPSNGCRAEILMSQFLGRLLSPSHPPHPFPHLASPCLLHDELFSPPVSTGEKKK